MCTLTPAHTHPLLIFIFNPKHLGLQLNLGLQPTYSFLRKGPMIFPQVSRHRCDDFKVLTNI